MFGAAMLGLLLLTQAVWTPHMPIARYDLLFAAALAIQAALWLSGLETRDEALAIIMFHAAGMVMEIVKTHYGSWVYPGDGVLWIGGVPLYSGFMYASVGSYMTRAWRLHRATIAPLGLPWSRAALAAGIYVNFFAKHFGSIPDMRAVLFVLIALVYRRAVVRFDWGSRRGRAPLLAAFFAAGALVWVAENIATFAGAWMYPHQADGWSPVGPQKFGSWFLLVIVSFELVVLARWATRRG